MSTKFTIRIDGEDFPLNVAKATHDYEGPSEIELPYAIEKDGRLYDPLYDMYVDEFEEDPFGGDPYCPNNICCACCGCDCE